MRGVTMVQQSRSAVAASAGVCVGAIVSTLLLITLFQAFSDLD